MKDSDREALMAQFEQWVTEIRTALAEDRVRSTRADTPAMEDTAASDRTRYIVRAPGNYITYTFVVRQPAPLED